jgi:hypothetical protein
VPITGVDRHPWAIEETRWTLRQLGLDGRARRATLERLPALDNAAVVAAYTLNELEATDRLKVEDGLVRAAERGASVLILEPLARAAAPWWDTTAARLSAAGGRADEWRFPVDLPPILRTLDKAAGLDHRELRMRTIVLEGPRNTQLS